MHQPDTERFIDPMSEPKRKTRPTRKKGDAEKPKPSGVGALLREERRNRSLEVRQVARMTRLRDHFIEAIEREAWEELPPPVFVRGFVRSYARALGLDAGRALELYDRSGPAEPEEPKPLLEPESSGRGRRIILLLLIGVLGGTLLYLWQGDPAPDWPSTPSGSPAADVEPLKRPVPPAPQEAPPPEVPASEDASSPSDPAPRGEAPSEREGIRQSSAPETAETASMPEREPLPEGVNPYPDPPPPEVASDEGHTLEIRVIEQTWVEISMDGGEPRDFMFQPGSRPRWKGGETFDLLIGNAAGIEVHFDGKVLTDLGKPGEVIRLILPKDLESRN